MERCFLKSPHRRNQDPRRRCRISKPPQVGGRLRAIACEQLEERMLLAAGTITWTGAVDGNWSTSGNWDLDRAPINGDSLVFPRTAQHLANNNDIAGLSVNSIAFQGTFTTTGSGYVLSGNGLTVGNGGITDDSIAIPPPGASAASRSFLNQLDCNVALSADESWANNDSFVGHLLTINGNVDNAGFNLSVAGHGVLDVAGQVSGSGGVGVTKGGPDLAPTLELQNANTYTGGTSVWYGTLIVNGSTAAASDVRVTGGTLGGTGTIEGKIAVWDAGGPAGALIPAGTLDPGPGPDPSANTGRLSNSGGVSFEPNPILAPDTPAGGSGLAQFAVQLGGTAADPTNDQLDSTGTISLEAATLDLTTLPGAGPFNVGQQFVIAQAGTPITTTFAGLPEGGTVSDGMQNFTISYANDRVTLTVFTAIPQTVNYLNGQAGDNTPATFVHNLYRETLGREAGAQELASWVNVYNQTAATAGATVAQQTVVAGFLGSREYREHLVEIVYESFLHRAADAGGLAFWTADLAAGMDEQSVLAGVVGSDEYFNDAQGPLLISTTPTIEAQKWVDALYRDLLGRTADAGGLTYWTRETLEENQIGREGVALDFLSVPEVSHKLFNGNYPGAAGSVGATGTPAVGTDALAAITGNGWDNLYFQGNLSAGAADSLFANLQAGTRYHDTIANMLEMPQYFGA